MILKRLRNLAAILVAWPLLAAANSGDEAVLSAYDAYRAGDPIRLARYAKNLQDHVLDPWIDYWGLAMRVEDATAAEVRTFMTEHDNTYVAELLRGDWLRVLGKRGDWREFERELALYPREDPEIQCYAWLAAAQSDEAAAFEEARGMWLQPRELPEGCARLADAMFKAGVLGRDDVWLRVRELFENGQITAAKTTLGYLSKKDSPDERMLADAARQPKRVLDRLPRQLDRQPTREVVVLAVVRYARNDSEAAAKVLETRLAGKLPEADTHYLWGRIAYEGARDHQPDALKWYARAAEGKDAAALDDDQLVWKARAALRAGRWDVVRATIEQLPASLGDDSNWIYWYGRALAAQGEETGARAYYLRIAGQTDFYGLLAAEELGYVTTPPEAKYVPADEEVERAGRDPGLARSLELIRLGIRTEGVREWIFTTRYFDDAKLLAAAELARRAGVWDRSISAADRTQRVHNFALRYPTPFRDIFSAYAKTYGLDEAWVLGLVRQESRFISDARSPAGAAGLMQVMPRTASFIARKIGMRDYRSKGVADVHTNVTLGTGYLKLVLDQLGSPVLASAAYNAGPQRAKRWRDVARPLEGAVYVETIPFSETRDYVKRVLSNAVFYSALTQEKPTALKARLGTVAPRGTAEPIEDELP